MDGGATGVKQEETTCCVVGGGPAGMMAGLLLARQGVDVLVLEKHPDFFRDFRGDTIHPATLQLLDEIGAIDDFLKLPHTRMERVTVDTPRGDVVLADFRKVGKYGFIAFVPQWDFLDFLAERASGYPNFRLVRPAEVIDLIEEEGRVVGVRATTKDGLLDVRADLVLGADGRHSIVRQRAGLPVISKSAPMDVLWLRVSRRPTDQIAFFRRARGSVLISIDRGTYWQLAYVIPQEGLDAVKQRGLPAFRAAIAAAAPALTDRVDEISDWEDVKLLSVRVDRLRRWYRPGLLCIGDAAHAMSPAGGVGINLAIQDAVAAANVLGPAFQAGGPSLRNLRAVQNRRQFPTRVVQAFQVRILRGLYPQKHSPSSRGGHSKAEAEPLFFRIARKVPVFRHLAGRFIGIGPRPEHVGAVSPARAAR